MARVIFSSSSFLVFRRQQAYSKIQPVWGNENWHTDRVSKPHVQHHINVTPMSFSAPAPLVILVHHIS